MNLREKLSLGKFVITVELDPPKSIDSNQILSEVRDKRFQNIVDAVNVTDCPMARLRTSPIALSHIIQEELSLETIFHITCRDRNLLGLQAELLGASMLGVENILALTGDPPDMGFHSMATGVYDLDSVGLVKMINGLNHGFDYTGEKLNDHTNFFIGAAVNPTAPDLKKEIKKIKEKIKCGAHFIQTQPIFDLEKLNSFLKITTDIHIPIIIGVMPLKSYKMVQYLENNLPDIFIPNHIKERMKGKTMEEGMKIARELIKGIKKLNEISGIHIFPLRNMNLVTRLFD